MSYYIGIDLGTTNSAICSYDGQQTRIWKSPEQNDVTPSAIYIDRRKNRYYGNKAYNQAPYNPRDAAILFKRFMGTNTRLGFSSAGFNLSPEECSAEILKVLFGYLPEEIRFSEDIATVITVPAAFNQMKKDATLQAARLAGIGKVALMQEPVAAIMSVTRTLKQEGLFLIYDLGGGTFDVSIAENIGGKVNLLSTDGVEMCGGRDFDKLLFHHIAVPWLRNEFNMPDDFIGNEEYTSLCRLAQWACEKAKIELSARNEAMVALNENEIRTIDLKGREIYLDIAITRPQLEALIDDIISETVIATQRALSKAGLSSNDIERIVFIGGPTNYKPLRDKVSYELALPGCFEVNPMTAVAEGASIFAESIDWSTQNHNRKASNAQIEANENLTFKYILRTTNSTAKVACCLLHPLDRFSVQFTGTDTGWVSGRIPLENNTIIELPLYKNGENTFCIDVYDTFGNSIAFKNREIVVTKTMAVIGAIPASHSVGVEAMERLGGATILTYLVKEGDALPKHGTIVFKAGQTIKAGTYSALNIKLWEGDIRHPITDNRPIGVLKIAGTDFEYGFINTGAEILCEYEMSDAGTIKLEISIPCIGASFGDRNFYSRGPDWYR